MAGDFGSYPAIVTDNDDPDQLGRLLLEIPGLLGTEDPEHPDWIYPCFAAAGPGAAALFFIPPVGAAVYVDQDVSGGLRWRGADFGGVNTIPPDLLVNYPRRSGFSAPGGRHLLALDDDTGFLAIVEDDDEGEPGARSYFHVGTDGTATIQGARGGVVRITPEEVILLSPAGNVLQMADGGSILLMHESGVEYLALGGDVAKLSGTAIQLYGGTIELGGGVIPPTNPYLLTINFLGALSLLCDEITAIGAAIPAALPYATVVAPALKAGITTSLASGSPYLSTRITGD